MSHKLLNSVVAAALGLGMHGVWAQPKTPADKAPKAQESRPATTHAGDSFDNAHALCIGCHGIPGYKTAYPEVYHVPMIAGQQPAYILSALKAYKSGDRSHPTMRGIASSLSEDTMKQLADYYGGAGK
jgi:cytochrome c553